MVIPAEKIDFFLNVITAVLKKHHKLFILILSFEKNHNFENYYEITSTITKKLH